MNNLCKNCRNETFWNLAQTSTWFTLFFIPVIPYSRKNLLICPICSYGYELEEAEQFQKLKPLAEENRKLAQGKITDLEYANRLKELTQGAAEKSLPTESNAKTLPAESRNLSCINCGANVPEGSNFCNTCGTKIPQ